MLHIKKKMSQCVCYFEGTLKQFHDTFHTHAENKINALKKILSLKFLQKKHAPPSVLLKQCTQQGCTNKMKESPHPRQPQCSKLRGAVITRQKKWWFVDVYRLANRSLDGDTVWKLWLRWGQVGRRVVARIWPCPTQLFSIRKKTTMTTELPASLPAQARKPVFNHRCSSAVLHSKVNSLWWKRATIRVRSITEKNAQTICL